MNRIAGDLAPLMKDVNEGELVSNLEGLTKVATQAAQDLRSPIPTPSHSCRTQRWPLGICSAHLWTSSDVLVRRQPDHACVSRSRRTLNNSVLTIENTDLLRQSVATLTKTLEHIEVSLCQTRWLADSREQKQVAG